MVKLLCGDLDGEHIFLIVKALNIMIDIYIYQDAHEATDFT